MTMNKVNINRIDCVIVRDINGNQQIIPLSELYAGNRGGFIRTTENALRFLINEVRRLEGYPSDHSPILSEYDRLRGEG